MATVRAQAWLVWAFTTAAGLVAPSAGIAQAQAPARSAPHEDAPSAPSLLASHDGGLREDIGWLVDRRVLSLPLGTWPLPNTLLRAALDARNQVQLQPADADALHRVERALARAQTPASARASINSARHPALNGESAARAQGEVTVGVRLAGGQWAGQLQFSGLADPLSRPAHDVSLAGSYVAVAFPEAMLAFGAVDRWWGPGRFASPILSNAAPPFPALLLRRTRDDAPGWHALRWMGPWGYELSLGELQDYHPAHTRTIGMRLYARPRPGLEIGLSRHIQWAGAGRPRNASALADALLGRSNIDGPADGEDPSNELAGLDVRLSAPGLRGTAWTAYGQVAGEDEANRTPSRLIATVGAQLKQPWRGGRLQWTLEATDTQMGRLFGLHDGRDHGPAYGHGTYVDGYYHQGLPIGANIGGGAHLHTLGLDWMPPCDHACRRYGLTLFGGRVGERGNQPINASFGMSGRLVGGSLTLQAHTQRLAWSLGLSVQRYPAGQRPSVGLQASIELPLQRAP